MFCTWEHPENTSKKVLHKNNLTTKLLPDICQSPEERFLILRKLDYIFKTRVFFISDALVKHTYTPFLHFGVFF